MSDNIDRDKQLCLVMNDDLGPVRRENTRTSDPKHSNHVNMQKVMADRNYLKKGTSAFVAAKLNQPALQAWSNVQQNSPDDGPEEINISDGQSHREALNRNLRGLSRESHASTHHDHSTSITAGPPSGILRNGLKFSLQNKMPPSKFSTNQGDHNPPVSSNLQRAGFPLDPAVDPKRATYKLTTKTRRGNGTKGKGHQADLSHLEQRRQRSKNSLIDHRAIQAAFSQALNQAPPLVMPNSRRLSIASSTKDQTAAPRGRNARLSVTTVKGWEPECLGANLTRNPAKTITAKDHMDSPNTPDTLTNDENSTKTPKAIHSPRLKLEPAKVKEYVPSPANSTEDLGKGHERSPKRLKIYPLRPLPAIGNHAAKPVNPNHDQIGFPSLTPTILHAEAADGHTQESDDTSNQDTGPSRLERSLIPDIRYNPSDPLATAAREMALSSTEDFWTYMDAQRSEGNRSRLSKPPRSQRSTVVPEIPITASQPRLNPVIRDTPSTTQFRFTNSTVLPAISETNPIRPNGIPPASLQPPTNNTQWTSPTQDKFCKEARSTSVAVDSSDKASTTPVDQPSISSHKHSTSSTGDLNDLTHRLSSWYLSSRKLSSKADSDEEEDKDATEEGDDQDDSQVDDLYGSAPCSNILIIGNTRVPIRDMMIAFEMGEREIRARYNPPTGPN